LSGGNGGLFSYWVVNKMQCAFFFCWPKKEEEEEQEVTYPKTR